MVLVAFFSVPIRFIRNVYSGFSVYFETYDNDNPDDQICCSWREEVILFGEASFSPGTIRTRLCGPESCLLSLSMPFQDCAAKDTLAMTTLQPLLLFALKE